MLLGEAQSAKSFMDLINILINNGVGVACAAAVLWLAWYRETKTLPALIATFESANKRNSDAMSAMTEGMQKGFTDRNQRALDAFTTIVREEREVYQRWHEENRGRLEHLATEVKENRHMIREMVHEIRLKNQIPSMPRPTPVKSDLP